MASSTGERQGQGRENPARSEVKLCYGTTVNFSTLLGGGKLLLDFTVGDDALLHGVDKEHAAWLQASLLSHILGGYVEHAGLRGQYDEIVLGHDIAAGAEAVAYAALNLRAGRARVMLAGGAEAISQPAFKALDDAHRLATG